jgi:hypothetical protein
MLDVRRYYCNSLRSCLLYASKSNKLKYVNKWLFFEKTMCTKQKNDPKRTNQKLRLNRFPRGLHLGLFRYSSRELICLTLVCMCVCMYVRHAQKIAKLFFVTASERAKHAVSFQIIKYIIQKNITTSSAPKYSVIYITSRPEAELVPLSH